MIIGNKLDIVQETPSKRQVTTKEATEYCRDLDGIKGKDGGEIFFGGETSCKSGEGVEEAMVLVLREFFERFPVCEKCKCPVLPPPLKE